MKNILLLASLLVIVPNIIFAQMGAGLGYAILSIFAIISIVICFVIPVMMGSSLDNRYRQKNIGIAIEKRKKLYYFTLVLLILPLLVCFFSENYYFFLIFTGAAIIFFILFSISAKFHNKTVFASNSIYVLVILEILVILLFVFSFFTLDQGYSRKLNSYFNCSLPFTSRDGGLCYYDKALKTNDSSLCKYSTSLERWCYFLVAVKSENSDLCKYSGEEDRCRREVIEKAYYKYQ